MMKFMEIVKDTMKNLYHSGEFKDVDINKQRNFSEEYSKEESKINLAKEEFNKFDDIVFKGKIIFSSNLLKLN